MVSPGAKPLLCMAVPSFAQGGLRHCSAECVLTLEGTAFAEVGVGSEWGGLHPYAHASACRCWTTVGDLCAQGDPDELAARGQLALVQLLQRCPTAAVFVRDVDRAHRAVLTGPLLTLTSESGSFMHMGKTVPATGSLVVLTMGGEDAPQTERQELRLRKRAQVDVDTSQRTAHLFQAPTCAGRPRRG